MTNSPWRVSGIDLARAAGLALGPAKVDKDKSTDLQGPGRREEVEVGEDAMVVDNEEGTVDDETDAQDRAGEVSAKARDATHLTSHQGQVVSEPVTKEPFRGQANSW